MNAQQIINSAMRVIGSLASGETPTNAEAQDALSILNLQMDSWNAERLMIYAIVPNTFTFVPGQGTYTLGTGGNFNMPRPPRIEAVSTILLSNPLQPLELPLEMLTYDLWQMIPVKNIQSTIPQQVYIEMDFPLINLSYWCVPSQANQTTIYAWTPLTQFADLFTDYTFPPGYLEAIKYQLAMRMYPEFGRPIDPMVAQLAVSAVARIKSFNVIPLHLQVDPAISSEGRHYNWRSDTYQ